jgi:hypothetical protein
MRWGANVEDRVVDDSADDLIDRDVLPREALRAGDQPTLTWTS